MGNKKVFKNINIIRVVACIAILLYHLGILKGGYLAVCVFFVLTGYLSCISAFRKEKFSFWEYYKKRILKIYVPLLLIVFLSVFAVSQFTNITWLNLKPETTSVLLGYNNYWQLGANLDYFARHVNSPFMHLWYIAILLQFEIIFPFIFMFLKKMGDKVHKSLPIIFAIILGIGSAVYFCHLETTGNMMVTYYDSLARAFSLLFGLALGFIHSYHGPIVSKWIREKCVMRNIIFLIYLVICSWAFYFVEADSPYFVCAMLGITFVGMRLIDYATLEVKEESNIFDKIVKYIGDISYFVYLVQYPIIFLFEYVELTEGIKIFFSIVAIVFVSIILYLSLGFGAKRRWRGVKYFLLLLILHPVTFGVYTYIITEDHTEEMKELENQLAINEKMIEAKQDEYALRREEEEKNWAAILDDLQNGEEKIADAVANLSVVGVGDSVMLGATDDLYKQFKNGYFDAKVSRSTWAAKDIIKNLKESDMLGETIVLNLGANGDCSTTCKEEIIAMCDGHQIFWLTVTNDADVHVNDKLKELAFEHDNLHIIDWNSISKNKKEYFYADGIHLTPKGRIAYTQAIYDGIYDHYFKEYEKKKQEVLDKHEQDLKNKVSFYGNDVLINSFDEVKSEFKDAQFKIDKEYDYDKLKSQLKKAIEDGTLNYNVVLAFDKTANLKSDDYLAILKLLNKHRIYLLAVDKGTSEMFESFASQNVAVIDFYSEIEKNEGYLMVDGIHLSKEGNVALSKLFKKELK